MYERMNQWSEGGGKLNLVLRTFRRLSPHCVTQLFISRLGVFTDMDVNCDLTGGQRHTSTKQQIKIWGDFCEALDAVLVTSTPTASVLSPPMLL